MCMCMCVLCVLSVSPYGMINLIVCAILLVVVVIVVRVWKYRVGTVSNCGVDTSVCEWRATDGTLV